MRSLSAAVVPSRSCVVVTAFQSRPVGVCCSHRVVVARPTPSSSPLLSSSSSHQQRLPPLRAKAKKQKQKKASSDDDEADTSSSFSSSDTDDVDLDAVALQAESDSESRMQKAVDVVASNFNTMRTGRANPAILDRIQVEYYGALTPLKQLASIAVPDASTLLVSPFDKAALKEIEKAINSSDIGLNPNNDGQNIRLNIPAMTQERRKELSKKVAKMGEDGKVAVRNIRKDILKKLDKYEFPKDTKKTLEDSVQKTTDGFVKKLDDMVKAKTDDIMKV